MSTWARGLLNSPAPIRCCFQRFELRLGGAILEDIYNADWLSNLLHLYESTDKRITTANMGFGTQDTMRAAAAGQTPQVDPQL